MRRPLSAPAYHKVRQGSPAETVTSKKERGRAREREDRGGAAATPSSDRVRAHVTHARQRFSSSSASSSRSPSRQRASSASRVESARLPATGSSTDSLLQVERRSEYAVSGSGLSLSLMPHAAGHVRRRGREGVLVERDRGSGVMYVSQQRPAWGGGGGRRGRGGSLERFDRRRSPVRFFLFLTRNTHYKYLVRAHMHVQMCVRASSSARNHSWQYS